MASQIIYTSHAMRQLDDQDLVELLVASRRNNLAEGIGGLLLYDDRVFAQYLEGDADRLDALMARIRRDSRHRGVLVVYREDGVNERLFPGWSMGFRHMRMIDRLGIPGLEPSSLEEVHRQLAARPTSTAALILACILASNRFEG